jgi:hypothetical protein
MLCAKCQSDNLPDGAFCIQCGAKLEAMCPSCGLSKQLGLKFCRKCGAKLATTSTATTVIAEHTGPREMTEGSGDT